MGGETVAKGVWAYVLGDAGAGGIHFDIVEDRDAREVAAAAVAQEYVVLLARFGRDVGAVVKPSVEFFDGGLGDGHQSLFAALARHADETLLQVEVAQGEGAEFADAQAATVKEFDDAMVAALLGQAEVHRLLNGLNFFGRENFGQVSADFGRFEEFGGVGFDISVDEEEMVETAHATEHAGHGAWCDAHVVELPGKAVQVVELHHFGAQFFVGQIVKEEAHIVFVGLAGVVA